MSFDSNIYEIINIVDDILGKPRRDASVEGWTEYNCPCCAEENGGLVDNKYNFCINYSKGVCHCWKCNTSLAGGKCSQRTILLLRLSGYLF